MISSVWCRKKLICGTSGYIIKICENLSFIVPIICLISILMFIQKGELKPDMGIMSIGEPVAGAGNVWDLVTGKDGKIYGGTGVLYSFFAYDPNTGILNNQGTPGFECYSITNDKDGIIYCGGAGGGVSLWEHLQVGASFGIYDPSRPWNPGRRSESNPRNMGPAVFMPDGLMPPYDAVIYDLAMGKNGRIYGGTGRDGWRRGYAYLFSYDPRKTWNPGFAASNNPYAMELPMPNEGGIAKLTVGHDGKIYGGVNQDVNPNGHLFVYNPKDNTISIIGIPVEKFRIGTLTTGIDGIIYGGTYAEYEKGHIFAYNPHSGILKVRGQVAEEGGLFAMTTGINGEIYLGTGLGELIVYYPGKPWKPGENPRTLGTAVQGELRIRCLTTGKDGTIYGGTGGLSAYLFKCVP